MQTEIANCDICGSNRYSIFCKKRGFEYVRCSRCGLIYVYSPLTETGLKKEAERLAQGHHLIDNKIESDYSDFICNVIHNPRLCMIENYRKNGRLLDIGCGNGAFLYSAKKRNWETIGVEISESSASYAKNVKGLNVYSGTIFDTKFPDEYFDAITMWEVIEHLSSPSQYLREINRIIRKNGVVLLSTPNFNSLARFIIGNRWEIFSPEKHLYVFSEKTVSKLFKKVGFRVIKLWTEDINPFTIVRNLRPKYSDDWDEKRKDVVKIFTTLKKYKSLRILRKLINLILSRLKVGDTLYVLVQKN